MHTLTLNDAERAVLIATLERAVRLDFRTLTASATDERVRAAMPADLQDRLVANTIILDMVKHA
jgi:hypothetical protein